MLLFPNAKINIGLNVAGKRPDGFHDIETVFYPAGLCDILELTPGSNNSQPGFKATGLPVDSPGEKNLCVKAFQEMSRLYNLPGVNIHLHKVIPIGAGLGGGSSDAAFTVKGLNNMFGLNIDTAGMKKIAGKTGSDTPFFILNKPVLASGRGNVFRDIELSLKGYYILIVYPGIKIDTAWAYSKVNPIKPHNPIKELIKLSPEKWQGRIVNDFEEVVFRSYPEIEAVKKTLLENGAVYASMSGSGSACYALFENPAAGVIRGLLPDCYICEGEAFY